MHLLRREAHHGAGKPMVGNGIVSEHLHVPGGPTHQTGDDADERALARPVGPEQPMESAVGDRQRQIVEGGSAVVIDLGEP